MADIASRAFAKAKGAILLLPSETFLPCGGTSASIFRPSRPCWRSRLPRGCLQSSIRRTLEGEVVKEEELEFRSVVPSGFMDAP